MKKKRTDNNIDDPSINFLQILTANRFHGLLLYHLRIEQRVLHYTVGMFCLLSKCYGFCGVLNRVAHWSIQKCHAIVATQRNWIKKMKAKTRTYSGGGLRGPKIQLFLILSDFKIYWTQTTENGREMSAKLGKNVKNHQNQWHFS